MSLIKFISGSLLVIGMSSVSICAQAAASSLTLVNNTDSDSTSIIDNNGICSSWMKDGVTKAHHTNVVSADTIDTACFFTAPSCSADVYMTKDCSGPVVATVYFDVNTGFKTSIKKSDKFLVSGAGFQIQMDQSNTPS